LKSSPSNTTPLEHVEHVSFLNWFDKEFPDVFIHAIPNGVHLSHSQRRKALLEGLRKGPSDLHVPAWHLYIEMKRQKGSVWGKDQKLYKEEVEKSGGTYLLCKGCANAINQINDFHKARNK